MITTSKKTAFCGVFCALSTVVLLCTFFPYATYALAALAGIVLIPIHLEFGTRYGLCCYAVTSLLALLLTPDPEAKFLYILFFGYYPLCHIRLSIWKRKAVAWVIKFALFNIAVIASYFIVTSLLKMIAPEESDVFLWILLIAANVVFVLYDAALVRVGILYRVRIHSKLQKFLK